MSKQLGINPEWDKLARDNGLGHWSCVSPLNNRLWVRSDGVNFVYNFGESPFEMMKMFDESEPIGKDWQQPSEPTLVQRPFEYPCDGALYFDAKTHEQYHVEEEIMNGIAGSVIMMVWE